MKKQSLLLLAAGMLTFAACNSGNQGGAPSQAVIDSMVNAKVMELQTQMQAKNDSIINAMATAKADSMMAAMKGEAPARPAGSEHKATERKHEPSPGSVTNRPGADNGKPKSVSDRPGAETAKEKPKSVSDRPGATPAK